MEDRDKGISETNIVQVCIGKFVQILLSPGLDFFVYKQVVVFVILDLRLVMHVPLWFYCVHVPQVVQFGSG